MEKILRELEELKNRNQFLEEETVRLQLLIKYYEEQLKHSKRKLFGSSSEHSGQKILFDEAENEANAKEPEPEMEKVTYVRRKKSTGKREEDLSGLPVEVIEHKLPEEERVCPECGEEMHVMGHETRRVLEVIPPKVYVAEHVTETYACRNCERTGTEVPFKKASQPAPLIKGSILGASLIAFIMVQKYMNALPLYRQQHDFFMNGVMLSRQTLANWIIVCCEKWLEPLYKLMKERLLKESVLHADETTLQVLREPGRASRTESYIWLYRTSGVSEIPIAIYEYQETRSSAHPKRFLDKWEGFLHTDGYKGYHNLPPDIIVVGCWAHLRRKFFDALKVIPPDARKGTSEHIGLNYCDRLFRLEQEFKKLNHEESPKIDPQKRLQARLERSVPIAEEFFSWASNVACLPKSLLGTAIGYALNQREYLNRVFTDGRLELSNNRAERSIKPFVIGRKNWTFSCSPKGAKASSIVYSIIETAKENGLKPYEYLKHVFETIPNISQDEYPSLLPWSKALPDTCRSSKIPSAPVDAEDRVS